jgi:hypothetical protein
MVDWAVLRCNVAVDPAGVVHIGKNLKAPAEQAPGSPLAAELVNLAVPHRPAVAESKEETEKRRVGGGNRRTADIIYLHLESNELVSHSANPARDVNTYSYTNFPAGASLVACTATIWSENL